MEGAGSNLWLTGLCVGNSKDNIFIPKLSDFQVCRRYKEDAGEL